MAARKKASAKTHSWSVLSNGQEIAVEAQAMDLVDGALAFKAGGHVSKMFADGAWTSVVLVEPEGE